jgi:hypothetical protein
MLLFKTVIRGKAWKSRVEKSVLHFKHKLCAIITFWGAITSITIYTFVCKTTILPVVLYGCETWSPTLRKEHRLRVFENRVLRRIFEPKMDEMTGEWRKLHNEELHNLYSSPDIIRQVKSRRMRWVGHVARMGKERKVYKVLVGKPEGKRPLGRPSVGGKMGSEWILGRLAWGC